MPPARHLRSSASRRPDHPDHAARLPDHAGPGYRRLPFVPHHQGRRRSRLDHDLDHPRRSLRCVPRPARQTDAVRLGFIDESVCPTSSCGAGAFACQQPFSPPRLGGLKPRARRFTLHSEAVHGGHSRLSAVLAHYSPLAGSWYPSGASELKRLLSATLENSVDRTGRFVRQGGLAFLVPHAAPAYSGAVAASVYRHVQAAGATRVVILGFSHRHSIQGIAVPRVDLIETPLGPMRIDRETAASLAASAPFHSVPEQNACDHSVEIQIPFLQTCVP